MKVAALIHFAVPTRNAGSEGMVHRMLSELAAQGHEVCAFVTDNPEPRYDASYRVDGVELCEVPRGDTERILEWAPDVIVTHH